MKKYRRTGSDHAPIQERVTIRPFLWMKRVSKFRVRCRRRTARISSRALLRSSLKMNLIELKPIISSGAYPSITRELGLT